MTEAEQFAYSIWPIVHTLKTREEFIALLNSELKEEELQLIVTAAHEGRYPVSLERLQCSLKVTEYINEIIKWKERFMGDKAFREYVESLVKGMD